MSIDIYSRSFLCYSSGVAEERPGKEEYHMMGWVILVAIVGICLLIHYDKKADSHGQSEAERRRGEAMLRAREARRQAEEEDEEN